MTKGPRKPPRGSPLMTHVLRGGGSWLKQEGITGRMPKEHRWVAKFIPRKLPATLWKLLKWPGLTADWYATVLEHGNLVSPEQDWTAILRKALAMRLKANREALHIPGFEKHLATLLDYQLKGGTLEVRDDLRYLAKKVALHPRATSQQYCMARLVLALCHSNEAVALTRPFHWLKMVLTHTEQHPLMGFQCYQKEDAAMKAAIIQLLTLSEE